MLISNGKELNRDFGLEWNDYGARWYDASIARWWSVDPLSEITYDQTSYQYVLNNPIKYIDPNGMFPSLGMEQNEAEKFQKQSSTINHPDVISFEGEAAQGLFELLQSGENFDFKKENQESLTQKIVDRNYKKNFRNEFLPLLRDIFELQIGDFDDISVESSMKLVNALFDVSDVPLESKSPSDPLLRMVEFTIVARDRKSKRTVDNPKAEIPGTRETYIIVPENQRTGQTFTTPGQKGSGFGYPINSSSTVDLHPQYRIYIIWQPDNFN